MLSGEMKNLKTYSSTKCSKQGLTDKLDLSPFVPSGLKVLHCQLIFDYELIGIGHPGVIRSSWKWCFSTCDYLMKKK